MSGEHFISGERRLLERGYVIELDDSDTHVISIGDGPCVDAEGNPHSTLYCHALYDDLRAEWGGDGMFKYFDAVAASFKKKNSLAFVDSDSKLLKIAKRSEKEDTEDIIRRIKDKADKEIRDIQAKAKREVREALAEEIVCDDSGEEEAPKKKHPRYAKVIDVSTKPRSPKN